MDIDTLLPAVRKNILLKNHTSFRIGGPAKYFFEARNKDDLLMALKAAKMLNLPFFILGGGSNLLVSDKRFKGLVVKLQDNKYQIIGNEIAAETGVTLSSLIRTSAKFSLSGLEWASGIPGTVGGAVFGNAGSFGKSMKDVVKSVEVIDTKTLKFKTYNLKKCRFSYRESLFKKKKNLIIVSVVLKLRKGNKSLIEKKIEKYLNYKKEVQPLNFPSAGSVFKNPGKRNAGELIEACGLKGKKIGKAKISEKHANFIVNLGGASAENVRKLITFAKKSVKKKFSLSLREEIQYLGF